MDKRTGRRKSFILGPDEEIVIHDPDIVAFVAKSGFFEKWQDQSKTVLMSALKCRSVSTGKYIQEQGQNFEDMIFLVSGSAKCIAYPHEHKLQYPRFYKRLPLNAEEQAIFGAQDFDRFKDMAVHPVKILGDNPGKRLSVLQCHRLHHMAKRSALRRIKGYTAAENYEFNLCQELCYVSEGEIIGDTEMMLGLPTVIFSFLCVTDCKILTLASASFEKVFKKNERTVEAIRLAAQMKLLNRLCTVPGIQCPLLAAIANQLSDIAPDKKVKATRRARLRGKPEEDEKAMVHRTVLEMLPGHWKRTPQLNVLQKDNLHESLKRMVSDHAKQYKSLKKTVVIKLDDKRWS